MGGGLTLPSRWSLTRRSRAMSVEGGTSLRRRPEQLADKKPSIEPAGQPSVAHGMRGGILLDESVKTDLTITSGETGALRWKSTSSPGDSTGGN